MAMLHKGLVKGLEELEVGRQAETIQTTANYYKRVKIGQNTEKCSED